MSSVTDMQRRYDYYRANTVPTIELVVTDLAGTLWSPDESVHPRVLAALEELAERQVPVIAATGRPRRQARKTLTDHGLRLDAVLHDGALGATAAEVVFHSRPFSSHGARQVVEVFASFDHEPLFETDDLEVDLVIGDHPSIPQIPPRSTLVCNLAEELPLPGFRAIAAVEPDIASTLVAAIEAGGAGHAWVSPSQFPDTVWILVRPPGCSKWAAVLSYCELVGADPTRVLAIGDGDNDIELLTNARVALAPDGASQLAREQAHHLVPPASAGGWAELLRFI